MDLIDIEIIRLLVRDKGGVMERRSWKSICKVLAVVQKPTTNKQSTPCSCKYRVTLRNKVYCGTCGGVVSE